MKRNRLLLYFCWCIAIVVLVLITFRYQGEFTEFYGIAETREIAVNSESAVEVKKIHIIAGQTIQKGDLLVELYNPELTQSINETTHKIEELKAKIASTVSDINYRIKQLQAEHDINRELTVGLKSINKHQQAAKKAEISSPTAILIEHLEKSLPLETNPTRIRIDMLERELNLMLEEKNKLYVFAQVSGVIGSVRCKVGEQISPFSTLLTLHPIAPSYIKGYVHEFVYTKIAVGQKVKVLSMANPFYSVTGEIVGVGSKIIEYPRRLRRMLEVQVYGREVQIRIPKDNQLLLGEKVLVSTQKQEDNLSSRPISKTLLGISQAKTTAPITKEEIKEPVLIDITVSRALRDVTTMEASGILYLPDLKKYLLVSDTTPGNRPILYLMDNTGQIEDELVIQGLDKIDDMEAIAEGEEETIYIVCSQDIHKGKDVEKKRKLLLRIKRDRTYLKLDKKVYLYDLLKKAAQEDKQIKWTGFLTGPDNSFEINIEGAFVQDNNLFLGFKSPQSNSKAAIIKISNISSVFEKNLLEPENVQLWQLFDLKDPKTGLPSGISDLYLHNKKLYILSYANKGKKNKKKKYGNVWTYDIENNKLTHKLRLNTLKPEGITFNPDMNEFMVTFDHGNEQPSKIMRLKGLL